MAQIAFLFAPTHHPAMRRVAGARKKLGRRSVFNLLGPLVNPASAPVQLMGVYDPQDLSFMAACAQRLGIRKVLVVHSDDGLDEVSPCAPTSCILAQDGELKPMKLSPASFGLRPLSTDSIRPGETLEESSKLLIEAISNVDSEAFRAVLPPPPPRFGFRERAESLIEGVELATTAVRDGSAYQKLQLLKDGAPTS